MDSKRNISFINSSVSSFGLEPEELIGKPLNVILNIADDHLPKIATNRIGERAIFNFDVIFKSEKDYPLWSETEFLPGQIDSYGLWSM